MTSISPVNRNPTAWQQVQTLLSPALELASCQQLEDKLKALELIVDKNELLYHIFNQHLPELTKRDEVDALTWKIIDLTSGLRKAVNSREITTQKSIKLQERDATILYWMRALYVAILITAVAQLVFFSATSPAPSLTVVVIGAVIAELALRTGLHYSSLNEVKINNSNLKKAESEINAQKQSLFTKLRDLKRLYEERKIEVCIQKYIKAYRTKLHDYKKAKNLLLNVTHLVSTAEQVTPDTGLPTNWLREPIERLDREIELHTKAKSTLDDFLRALDVFFNGIEENNAIIF